MEGSADRSLFVQTSPECSEEIKAPGESRDLEHTINLESKSKRIQVNGNTLTDLNAHWLGLLKSKFYPGAIPHVFKQKSLLKLVISSALKLITQYGSHYRGRDSTVKLDR